MIKIPTALIATLIASSALAADYKAESAGAPPTDLPASYTAVLQKEGTKITGPSGVISEIWLVATAPNGPASSEANVTFPNIPHGSLMGIVRFPSPGKDRRGSAVKPGIYTVRYTMFPISGDHQGIAPQRDFWALTRIADDPDPKAAPNYDTLMDWSRKASGTPHPLVMSVWKADDAKADFYSAGEADWVLQRQLGNLWIAIVVVGTSAA